MFSLAGTGFDISNRLLDVLQCWFQRRNQTFRVLVEWFIIDQFFKTSLGSPGYMSGPFSVERRSAINPNQITGAALIIDHAVHAYKCIHHGDPFSKFLQRGSSVDHHIPMQSDRLTWSRKNRGLDTLQRWVLPDLESSLTSSFVPKKYSNAPPSMVFGSLTIIT